MRSKFIRTSCALFTLGVTLWGANVLADANVKIASPTDGGKIKAGAPLDVVYEIIPNAGGDHSHIYVNGKEAGILRKLKSTFTLDPLPAGTHALCIKVVNKGHASIGQDTCIKVTAN